MRGTTGGHLVAQRRTAAMRGGRAVPINRVATTTHYLDGNVGDFVIHKQKPGRGYRHVLTRKDVARFLTILPDWPLLRQDFNAVVLATAEPDGLCQGWHRSGVIGVCAWKAGLWDVWPADFYGEHAPLLRRLGVPVRKAGGQYECRFTEATVRAYQLLHVLTHELGHHLDRMTTRSQWQASRGESFAEARAWELEAEVFEAYGRVFGFD